jgi:tetratricopeptide (TPR) repeat protein
MPPSRKGLFLTAGLCLGVFLLGLNLVMWQRSTTAWRLSAAEKAHRAGQFDRAIHLYEMVLRKERLNHFRLRSESLKPGSALPMSDIERTTLERLLKTKMAKVRALLAQEVPVEPALSAETEERAREALEILEETEGRLMLEAPRLTSPLSFPGQEVRKLRAEAHWLLGLRAVTQGFWDKGLDHFEEAATLSSDAAKRVVRFLENQSPGPPYGAEVAFYLGRAYRRLGHIRLSQHHLERAITLARSHLPALLELKDLAGEEAGPDGQVVAAVDEQLRSLSPSVPMEVPLGDGWTLMGYDLDASSLRPGLPFSLTLYIQARRSIEPGQEHEVYLTVEELNDSKKPLRLVLLKGVFGRVGRPEGVARGEVLKLTSTRAIPSHPRDLIIQGEVQPNEVVRRTPVPAGAYEVILWFRRITAEGSKVGLGHVTLPHRLIVNRADSRSTPAREAGRPMIRKLRDKEG